MVIFSLTLKQENLSHQTIKPIFWMVLYWKRAVYEIYWRAQILNSFLWIWKLHRTLLILKGETISLSVS